MGKQSQFRMGRPRSWPIAEWPETDRLGWIEAIRPAQRLTRGGAASDLASVSQADIANRYGLYLDYLHRNGQLEAKGEFTSLVTAQNVRGFTAELQARVRTVTVWSTSFGAQHN